MILTIAICTYNRSDLIAKCLDTLKFFEQYQVEILIVDDCSTDDTKEILEDYKIKFPNFKIIKNDENKGIGMSRNIALDNAKGKYIWFLDSDDLAFEKGVKDLMEHIENENTDLIMAKYIKRTDHNIDKIINRKLYTPNQWLILNDRIKLIQDKKLGNKIFRLEFLRENEIDFLDLRFYENRLFVDKSLVLSNSISILEFPFYCEVERTIHTTKFEQARYIRSSEKVRNYLEFYVNSKLFFKNYKNGMMKTLNRELIKYLTSQFRTICRYIPEEELVPIYESVGEILRTISPNNFNNISKANKISIQLLVDYKYDQYTKYVDFLNDIKIKGKKHTLLKKVKTVLFHFAYTTIKTFTKIDPKKVYMFTTQSNTLKGNLLYINNEIIKFPDYKVNTCLINGRTEKMSIYEILKILYNISTSKYVITNDLLPFSQKIRITYKEGIEVIQAWHAAGAFKKFGNTTLGKSGGVSYEYKRRIGLHENYTKVLVSSTEVKKHYAQAFEMDESKIFNLGIPRVDLFYDNELKIKKIENVYKEYPILQNKKIYLYAPTFRGKGKDKHKFNNNLDYNLLLDTLGENEIFIIKNHPFVNEDNIPKSNKFLNLSNYPEINDLLLLADVLITDYSSTCFDFSILEKPMIFYAYDLLEYSKDRDFYYEYEDFVPGPIVKNTDELVKVMIENKYDLEKVKLFKNKFFDNLDGKASQRFVETFITNNNDEITNNV